MQQLSLRCCQELHQPRPEQSQKRHRLQRQRYRGGRQRRCSQLHPMRRLRHQGRRQQDFQRRFHQLRRRGFDLSI